MAIAIEQIYVIVIVFVYSDQNKSHLAGASSQESKAESSRRRVSSASSVVDPGEGPGRPGDPGPPLCLDQTEARRAEKNFFFFKLSSRYAGLLLRPHENHTR